jgi:Ca2+-binding RTX toxin-like protein
MVGLALAGVGFGAVAASGVVAEAAEEEVPRCHGRIAKIVGTDGDDVLHGTPSRDVIYGGKGDDRIYGSLGNDLICGGTGADLIHGGRGNDEVDGGPGARDRVIGDLGDDKVMGGAGDYDEVAGDLGIDIVNGGAGDHDLVHGDYGWDRMSGGAGKGDIASFATNVAGGKGAGVWASLEAHKARGDGHDKLFKFEALEGSAFGDTLIGNRAGNAIYGGPGDDTIFGGGGRDTIDGGQGSDGCKGAKGRTTSCGKEKPPNASAYVELNRFAGGGAGLQIVGGAGPDHFVIAYDEPSATYVVAARKGIATGPGCTRPTGSGREVACAAGGPALWLTADLGPGDDSVRVAGSMLEVGNVRLAGGNGDDVLHGGPEDDLIESGRGADKLYGHAGADGLVGGLPGPTYLFGGENGDLLAAGGGCAGGAIVGGPGRDDASFAETGAHPGLLFVSFPAGKAWVTTVEGCDSVRLADDLEDMEGSFDNDILIGNARKNAMLGQPGQDRFFGNGGDDVIDARDGVRDFSIQCGRGRPARRKPGGKGFTKPTGTPAGRALTDDFDPSPFRCTFHKFGTPVPGLHG